MKMKRYPGKQIIIRFTLISLLILLTGFTVSLFAKDGKISLAVLPFENLNRDPEQDYLSGIITSLVRRDLSLSGMVFMVDRDNLEDVLQEQKLQFTGILDEKSIIETGRLVGAEYILKGGYVFLGEDLFLNLDLINTETGGSFSFSERGYQENTVHALTERLVRHLTGQDMSFQSDGGDKSIIASSQREPGRIMLFSPLIDARIYIDGEFKAYTPGDSTKPVEMILPAGEHSIRIHLTKDFGVIQTPEILFGDWKEYFNLKPGETLVLEDKTAHFNSILYDMQQIVRERILIVPGSGETKRAEHNLSFQDRQGNTVPINLQLSFVETGEEEKSALAVIHLEYKDEVHDLTYNCLAGETEEFELELDKSSLKIDLDCSSTYRWELDYAIWRSDIYQGLHREEEHQSP